MGVDPPTIADLAEIARHYEFHLGESDLESYRALVTGALESYRIVEQLFQDTLPEPPSGRTYQRPQPEQNPLGAWYVTTRISTGKEGPLTGRTVAVKDNVAVAGIPMMNGSRSVEGFVPRRDATVVTRLLEAGATVVGKAVCEDLCFSGASHTAATGPVRNPWDPNVTAGGSSSGSAVLVATGEADLAVGGDQGGSIRIPSAFCGVVGHKPTRGLVPYTGAFPIENTLDHLGPITFTTRDAALMLGVMAGPDGLDPRQRDLPPAKDYLADLDAGISGLRVAVVEEGFGLPGLSDPQVDEEVLAATRRLERAGAKVSHVSIPWHRHGVHVWNVIAIEGATTQMVDGNGFGMNWSGYYDPELIAHYAQGRRDHADSLSDTVKLTVLAGRYTINRYGGRYYGMAQNLARSLTAAYDAVLAEFDVLVMPTLPYVATPIEDALSCRENYVARALEMIVNTAPFDVTGHPATTVPAGMVKNLPVGMMIIGRHFQDDVCLRVAQAYETAVGGFTPPPGSARRAS
ncbi:amidase [Carbonactinospora thermoautotrophica]|uniref:Amidase n=1 Tax=Carbonactinospora thermoautotrophica TaxID=1469144 RepID=A0A132MTS9_9ACTN|nr:amidase [Carbonactinospora thermoautotrophica]KWX01267.1 Amidase [Carbonactinospora thermoautotrophica]KWX05754.1 amidase [Carbonactinospora thermoautotrophica]KWX07718.1 amidase [Carbonactinospora thermoautotrophica]